ncbi:MAG TPA: LPXTG cell wall anchor domain-containing protein [Candidatus Saccharimonadales bacterium]|nr:LPXTG cell wall anchor domain-containing protein [Candidatus Saccharimonadales bacterium]
MTKTNVKNLIVVALSAGVLFAAVGTTKAYADCESNYGGGETCNKERSFTISKKVRIAKDSGSDKENEWKDKVTDVNKGDTIEFRITVKNTGNASASDMEMIDKLPEELQKLGGSGLTEEWDDFGKNTTKTFYIIVQVKNSEFDNANFDKCVVNKATLKHKGDKVGSDTATVCYGNGTPTELPKTGGPAIELTLIGLGLIGLAVLIKKSRQLA